MRTAKKRQLYKTSSGYSLTPLVQTTVEENIAHALGVTSHFPDEYCNGVRRHLLGVATTRIIGGTADLRDVIKVVEASLGFDGLESNRSDLIETAVRKFDEPNNYEEPNDLMALCYFIESVPEVIDTQLIERVKLIIEEEADLIFDWDITSADDEHTISQLREDISRIESAFDVDLVSLRERLDEREEEIKYNDEEPPDDWGERGSSRSPEASDSDILAMFEGLKE